MVGAAGMGERPRKGQVLWAGGTRPEGHGLFWGPDEGGVWARPRPVSAGSPPWVSRRRRLRIGVSQRGLDLDLGVLSV